MRRRPLLPLVAVVLAAGACTSLGPTPSSTLVSARPAGRADFEAQAAIVPGHYISSAVVEDPAGAGIPQLAAVFEPDRALDVPGLIIGGRVFGESGDSPIEPMIGYRRALGDGTVALGGVLFGTRARASAEGASYQATRGGAELAADVRLTGASRWLEVHAFGGVAVTALSVDGTYCTDDDMRFGRQCPEAGEPPGPRLAAHASGVYPATHAGLGAELFRNRDAWFHGGRVALLAAVGAMPRVEHATQTTPTSYASIGLAVALSIGDE